MRGRVPLNVLRVTLETLVMFVMGDAEVTG